jgi:hypothetical protein
VRTAAGAWCSRYEAGESRPRFASACASSGGRPRSRCVRRPTRRPSPRMALATWTWSLFSQLPVIKRHCAYFPFDDDCLLKSAESERQRGCLRLWLKTTTIGASTGISSGLGVWCFWPTHHSRAERTGVVPTGSTISARARRRTRRRARLRGLGRSSARVGGASGSE